MTIRVLCLEDNEAAAARLRAIAEESAAPESLVFEHFGDVMSAKTAATSKKYDVAIVDIQVPIRRGQLPKLDGGTQFLDFVLSSPRAIRPTYIVGITGERAAFEAASPKFAANLFGLLERSDSDASWETSLSGLFAHVTSQTDHAQRDMRSGDVIDLLIVCAIRDSELGAIKRWTGIDFVAKEESGDPIEYWTGLLKTKRGDRRVTAFAAPEQGMPAAAAIVSRVAEKVRPRVVAMAGIAAAISSELGFGDVLYAEQTWDYTTGKRTKDADGEAILKPENRSIRIDPLIVDQLRRLSGDGDFLAKVREEWPAEKPNTALKAIGGSFSSGGGVVESPDVACEVLGRDRKTIAIDMEAHGVCLSCWYGVPPRPQVVIAKSVVDHGVPPKTDKWHPYAAYTSARFISEWAKRFL